ncbi:hypothetical protein HNQ77_005135 [Silvibacterium bohemicum]|uniref:Uncharacterized protein n=1 Tax=Silvibacterium bohemicum TaxID=1577686 RepID=A0A841K179_9BACT|nr:hypothetical protein [Silvibacterium bohemicum]
MKSIKKTIDIQSLKGIIPRPKKPISIEDMNEAVAECGANSGGLENLNNPARQEENRTVSKRHTKNKPGRSKR